MRGGRSAVGAAAFLVYGGRPMRDLVDEFLHDDSAATAVEYALLAGLIGLVVIVGMNAAFTSIATKFNVISNTVSTGS